MTMPKRRRKFTVVLAPVIFEDQTGAAHLIDNAEQLTVEGADVAVHVGGDADFVIVRDGAGATTFLSLAHRVKYVKEYADPVCAKVVGVVADKI